MRYALIEKGAVAKYPYGFAQLRADNPQVSFPREMTDEGLAEWGVATVADVPQPAASGIGKNVVEGAPALVNGAWAQTWAEVDASADEIAARQKSAAVEGELSAAKLDAWIVSYLAMTPDGAEQFVLNNTATLAQLRNLTAKLAYAVRVLIRREFNV